MTTFEITYTLTGKHSTTNKMWIDTYDKRANGERVANIVDAIGLFEEITAGWGSYETKNAITNIKVTERR